MYTIKQSDDFNGALKLITKNGPIILNISFDATPDMLQQLRKLQVKMIELQEKSKKQELRIEDIDALGRAIIDIFTLLLGADNMKILAEVYNNKPQQMFNDIYPYIRDVLQPEITKAVKRRAKKYKHGI